MNNKTKHVFLENEIIWLKSKFETFESSLFIVQRYFNNDGSQNYLTFQSLYYTFKRIGNTEKKVSWKCKGLSDEKLATPNTTDYGLFPSINWYENSKLCLIFKGSCLKLKKWNLYSS